MRLLGDELARPAVRGAPSGAALASARPNIVVGSGSTSSSTTAAEARRRCAPRTRSAASPVRWMTRGRQERADEPARRGTCRRASTARAPGSACGTKLVMNACRASANTAVARPMRKMPTPSTSGFGATRQSIDADDGEHGARRSWRVRSPMRLTIQPLGMSPTSSPSMIMRGDEAGDGEGRRRGRAATAGMIGMIAPSPIENSSVGRSAGSGDGAEAEGGSVLLTSPRSYTVRAATPDASGTAPPGRLGAT